MVYDNTTHPQSARPYTCFLIKLKMKKSNNTSYSYKSHPHLIRKRMQLNTEQKYSVNLIIIPHENTSHVHTHAHGLFSNLRGFPLNSLNPLATSYFPVIPTKEVIIMNEQSGDPLE